MRRRAQAAMEFLMTYGWAILVVLIVIAALAYFGVLNPGRFQGDQCTVAAPFGCTDSIIKTGDFTVNLRYAGGVPINITEINVTLANGSVHTATLLVDQAYNDGATLTLNEAVFSALGVGYTEGTSETLVFDIVYYKTASGAEFTKTATVDVKGRVQG
ncbi:hypothetical protein HYW21_04315 [Candidatus Woesearchaeota archaeon]|nr:hypothetical protein [Candidatus Woesearchaeota archaeon]